MKNKINIASPFAWFEMIKYIITHDGLIIVLIL